VFTPVGHHNHEASTQRPAPLREPGVMTEQLVSGAYAVRMDSVLSPEMAACAAASRAIGTR
jgi:hypothetical protein